MTTIAATTTIPKIASKHTHTHTSHFNDLDPEWDGMGRGASHFIKVEALLLLLSQKPKFVLGGKPPFRSLATSYCFYLLFVVLFLF